MEGSMPQNNHVSESGDAAAPRAAENRADPGAAEDLAKTIAKVGKKGPAPVHLWNPPFCGDLDIRIKRDGSWWYLGTPIGRERLVKLFASVLRLDGDGKYYLVTPVEKVGIIVDDAPFVAVDFRETGGADPAITFVTNVGDETVAGPENPIRVARDPETGEPSPYVHVRRGLEALIDRKSFYRLVEICVHEDVDGESWFGLRSGGVFFAIIASADLVD
ncbi:MAG: hypothetical protein ACJAVR_003172 [Paracoccaceae bacterium]|jgi:hypothetical protein